MLLTLGTSFLRINHDDSESKRRLHLLITNRILVARFDSAEECAKLAGRIWHENEFMIDKQLIDTHLIGDISSTLEFVRESASKALHLFATEYPDMVENILERLAKIYRINNEVGCDGC
jgi:hypothetical protein